VEPDRDDDRTSVSIIIIVQAIIALRKEKNKRFI
jgi:hypothetical protein